MIVGGRKPAKLADTPNLEFSSVARRRSKFVEFPLIIVLQPLFPVLLSVPQIPPPAMYGRSHQPPCSIRMPPKALDLRLRQLRQSPLMRSRRPWIRSSSAIQNKRGGPYGAARSYLNIAECKPCRRS